MKRETLVTWLRAHPFLVIVGCCVAIDFLLLFTFFTQESGTLHVSFLDVGQGDAILIQAPNGNQILYDAGPPSGASLRALAHELPFWDRSIDVAVFSHPDMDHIGGFPELFTRYDVGVVLEPGATSPNGVYDSAEVAITDRHLPRLLAHKGMQIDLGEGVVADILYPDHDARGMETNSASIVMRVHYGATAFLLSGDLPQAQENDIAKEFGAGLHAQVLKLGHHGSRTSSSPYWLAAVGPDMAIISAGKNNRYGHPHQEVLALLQKLNIPYLQTFDEGTITFQSDGELVTRD